MSEAKQEYVGSMMLVFNAGAPDKAPLITGMVEVDERGYKVSLWKAEGKDGKATKLAYSGTLTCTGDDKKTKRGYISLLKPSPDAGKTYALYGFLKFDNDKGEFITTHMVYLYKQDIPIVLCGGLSEYEEYEKTESSNVPGVPSVRNEPTKSKQQEINYDAIPF
jgi:hypothetical protein